MKRIIAIALVLLILAGIVLGVLHFTRGNEDIVILYENDVHSAIDGYSKLAALKNELKQTYEHVGVVSSGDYIQGGSVALVSKGEYIVNLMNLVGYDALTLGNHEFDYHLTRLNELVDMMDTKPVCCNFERIGEDDTYFEPYSIVSYGSVDIAYVGVTTPDTISVSSPAQFKDEDGNYIYTFHPNDLYETVQSAVSSAISDGADYVVALSHVGDNEPDYDVEELIASTTGIDVVLDAHSHSVIEGRTVKDNEGNDVVLSSTGTKFEHIGKLTISDKGITTELIKTEEYDNTDPVVDAYLAEIEAEYSALGDRIVATSEVDLITHDAEGNRLVRISETNLGDLCADAFRTVMGADVSFFNGGGLRAPIEAGDVTFNDLLNVLPFNNQVVLAEVSGEVIRDMLELAIMEFPEECSSFPHVSAMTFSINTGIESSVVLDENGGFLRVDGQYRVQDIKIFDKESGEYKDIDLSKKYTIAAQNYFILEYGSGMQMFKNATILRNEGTLDVEVLESYITEVLGGVIGEEYAEVKPNITFIS